MKHIFLITAVLALFLSCNKSEELSLEELEAIKAEGLEEILVKTTSKPWRGEEFLPGKVGGTWNSLMNEDPKSFNHLIAEQDSTTSSVVGSMTDELIEYDVSDRSWKPRMASYEIKVDNNAGTLDVIYTLRDDIYWSYYNSSKKVKVTSDDFIFWYDEIQGDPECLSSSYNSHFLTMPDGSEANITIHKIDDRSFYFHFPRIIADPLLSTNMDFGPRHIYQPAKEKGIAEGGAEGGAKSVRDVFSVAVNPKTIPSLGEWFLVEYTPGQRLVYKRNPDYWRKDAKGVSLPYIKERIIRIIPDENTKLLLFKEGKTDSYSLRPEDLDGLINKKEDKNTNSNAFVRFFRRIFGNKGDTGYTVFNAEGSLSASFWTFNQNPVNKDKPSYEWFTQKEFRQAMSCLLNRDRINTQVYRGLAEPKLNLFPEPNPYYNPNIKLQYLFDEKRAVELLASIGIKKDSEGNMRDNKNRRIEFDLSIRSESTMSQDIASIIRDELSKVGIKVNIRIMDFQKQVEQLFTTYDWDSIIMALSGSNIFPTQGSNVWPTNGNLHLWNPNQKTPATKWEARIDYLYNEGQYTIDSAKAQVIWDEFQSILMEQCVMIHLMRSRGFWAINNRWDLTNVYYDNIKGAETNYIYLR